MAFQEVIKKTRDRSILFSALLELTYRCNLDCFFCYNDLGAKGVPLPTETYFRFFEDLRDMQVMNIIFSGGEPLAHPDFMRLGQKARELGFVVRLKSNGHALHGKMAQRIKEEVDPFVIEVSLHGARPETHDRQTRVPGSFERLIANLRDMQSLGLRLKVNCTLTRWNENEIEDIFALAKRLELPLHVSPEVTPRDNGDRSILSVSPSAQGLRRVFRLQAARARDAADESAEQDQRPLPVEVGREADEGMPSSGEKHCGAGSSGVAVDPFGNVYPCVQWRQPVGNLHHQSIKEIWTGAKELEEIRGHLVEAKQLVASYGAGGEALTFCPGLARATTGSPTRMYPTATRRMEIADEVNQGDDSIELPVLPK